MVVVTLIVLVDVTTVTLVEVTISWIMQVRQLSQLMWMGAMAYRRRGTKRTVCRHRRGFPFGTCRIQGERAIVGDSGGHGRDVGRVAGRVSQLTSQTKNFGWVATHNDRDGVMEAVELELLLEVFSVYHDACYELPLKTYIERGVMEEVVKADVALILVELNPVGPAEVEKLEVRLGMNELKPEEGAVGPAVLL